MPSPDEQFLDSSSYPRADLESPFLDGELFLAETEAEWEPRVERLQAESPFQRALDEGIPIVTEERTSEKDYAPEDESLLFEAESAYPLHTLAPSELKAVRITSTFETGRPGSFGGLTGNFDGQGVSFGLMNYAWKAGSLVTLLKEFLRDHPAAFAEVFGPDAARFRDMLLATKPDPKNPARQVRDVDRQMDFARDVLNDANNTIREPWGTYFQRLENSPAFQRIQVKAVRGAAERARYWCEYFGLKTERAFAFMFDLVTSHGGAWLNAPKFGGRRRDLLRAMLEQKQAAAGRPQLTELEKLEVIANMIADVSLPRWRQNVRVRKLWFVRGRGKVHGKFWDLAKDFGITDSPPDFGTKPGLNEFEEEFERYGWDETNESGVPEREWEDQQADRLRRQESLDHVDEAPSQEVFDEEALADLSESSEQLYGEEPEEDEESFSDDATSLGEALFEPEEAGIESEEEFEDLDQETPYAREGTGLDEASFIEAEDELDLEYEVDPAQGQTLYLPIELNKTVPPRVGVFVPRGFRRAADLDLITYFHGHIIRGCKTDPGEFTKEGIKYYWNTPLFKCLREELAASGRGAILIAPTFSPIFAPKDKYTPHAFGDLDQAGKFDFLINAALTQLKKSGALPEDARVRRIVLSGHSGGGLPMRAILDAQNVLKQKIAECWGFECLYFGTSAWEKWLSANPDRHFRHYRRPAEFTGATEKLQKYDNFVDVNNATNHCRVVDEKWRHAIDNTRVFHGPAAGGPPTSSPTSRGLSTLFSLLAGLPGLASLPLAFMTALLQGFRDENHLTNLVFLARHPELGGRKLTRSDPQFLKDEWVSIQRTIVRPALRRLKEAAAKPSTNGASQRGTAGPPTRAAAPGWRQSDATSEYALTEEQRKTLAGQTATERARDLAAFDRMARTRLATLTSAEEQGTLRGAEAQELGKLRALRARVDAAQAALKRLDVEEVLAAAGHAVAEWYGQVQRGSFLGIPLRVHRSLAERLTRAEAALVGDPVVNPDKLNAAGLGAKLKMYPSTSDMRPPKAATGGTKLSMHTFGLAVDLNYTGNPFVGNASMLVPKIVQRATGLVLGTPIDLMTKISGPREAYDTLTKASAALKTYLAYRDPANLMELTEKVSAHSRTKGEPADVAGWLAQIEKDRTSLHNAADFSRHKPAEEGFIDLDRAVVLALTGAGLTWGGTYPSAKDVMHFDLRQGDGAKVQAARVSHRDNV